MNLVSWLRNQSGVFMAHAILLTFVFMVIVLALAEYSVNNYSSAQRDVTTGNALLVAEAGAEKTLLKLNTNEDYTPPAGETEFYNTATKGRATYEVSMSNGTITNEKIIQVTGRLYRPSNASAATVTRKLKVTVVANDADYVYSVQTGPGGLIMDNASTIANGQVYVNGTIALSGLSSIGTLLTPLTVTAADVACPTTGGATFPVLCGSTHKSISITGLSRIYGAVHKKNTVDSSGITGTIDEVGADEVSMPDDDRAAIKTAIQNTGTTMTSAAASCGLLQTRTWGNVHITGGNVTVSSTCVVTITGNVWIDGGVTVTNLSQLKISNSLGSSPTIMTDGSTGFKLQNTSLVLTNSSGIGGKFISFYCGAGCSPDSTPTGSTLFSAKDTVTAEISNLAGASGSVLYARWGRARMDNGTSVGGLIGQSVYLHNASSILFGAGLGGGGSADVFSIKFYQEVF